jgi:hypothetical protein
MNNIFKKKQISICYNIANSKVWSDIFKIKNIEDVRKTLNDVHMRCNYGKGDKKIWWTTDQRDLYDKVVEWNKVNNKLVFIHKKGTPYLRLVRNKFNLNDEKTKKDIKNGLYCDFHCRRPYKKFKKFNEEVYNLLE